MDLPSTTEVRREVEAIMSAGESSEVTTVGLILDHGVSVQVAAEVGRIMAAGTVRAVETAEARTPSEPARELVIPRPAVECSEGPALARPPGPIGGRTAWDWGVSIVRPTPRNGCRGARSRPRAGRDLRRTSVMEPLEHHQLRGSCLAPNRGANPTLSLP